MAGSLSGLSSGARLPRQHLGTLDLQGFVPYRLSVLADLIGHLIAVIYNRDAGLSTAEWRLLSLLAHHGPLSANGVCARAAMDKVRVSRAVSRAVKRKLIDRAIDPSDRRRSVLTLTREGRTLHDRVLPTVLDRESALLAALSREEVDQFCDLMNRLHIRALEIEPALAGRRPAAED